GVAELGTLPGEQVLVATRGAERSAPWRGLAPDEVTLTLAPSFEVGGQVVLPDWSHLNYSGERRIEIAALDRDVCRSLLTIRSVGAGAWGPVSLPRLDVEGYRIRLEGSPIIPCEVIFPPPAAGSSLTEDLVAELGTDVWVCVTDEKNEVI